MSPPPHNAILGALVCFSVIVINMKNSLGDRRVCMLQAIVHHQIKPRQGPNGRNLRNWDQREAVLIGLLPGSLLNIFLIHSRPTFPWMKLPTVSLTILHLLDIKKMNATRAHRRSWLRRFLNWSSLLAMLTTEINHHKSILSQWHKTVNHNLFWPQISHFISQL